ncbi:MAG: 3-phosphoshikimate 1-carboxyvinyltransferase [Methanocorpusculum sp.]|nr:3-phosphoshikimate 1-carboxyvinyltransferase [Methanocorpusculum sp.]
MKLCVSRSELRGVCAAPPSKSHTHRAYMLAAMAAGTSKISSPLFGADTDATLAAVEALGAKVTRAGDDVFITGGNLHAADGVIDCKNSGSSMRMLAGIAARLPGTTAFTGDASLCGRPMKPLLDALAELGARVESAGGCAPFSVTGPVAGATVHISGGISSQFISALLLGAPLSPSGLRLHLTEHLASRPYAVMTAAAMQAHGVIAEETPDGFFVPAGQSYRPADAAVSGDYSSAAFLLAGAAISGRVTVTGLEPADAQGDKEILSILARFGAQVSRDGGAVTVEKAALSGVDLDMEKAPDLFPITAVLAACAKGTSRLFGARHLAFKESNRIVSTAAMLHALGADISAEDDGCTVRGGRPLTGVPIITAGDHRIAMAGAIAGLAASGTTEIDDISCAAVSYPGFVRDLKSLGATIL